MHIICLTPLEDGVYNDNKAEHIIAPPEGWAYIPEDFQLPTTFPRLGSIEVEEMTYTKDVLVEKEGEIVTEPMEYKMVTVTKMTEGTLPEPKEAEHPTSKLERLIEALYKAGKLTEEEYKELTATEGGNE